MLNRRGYWFIAIALILAFFAGALPGLAEQSQSPFLIKFSGFIITFANVVSEVFVRLLKLISLPMISLSLLATISSVGEQSLTGIGKRIVTYTILTTGIAASIALLLYETIQPVILEVIEGGAVAQNPSYFEELLKVIPSNLVQPFLEGNVVSILLLSLLLGVGIAKLPAEQRQPINQLLQSLFQMMIQLTRWIVSFMPIAVWGFMTSFFVEVSQGLSFSKLGWYLTTILSANLIQAMIVLPLFLWWHGISPLKTFTNMLPALSFAFFSKSSAAAMPTAIDCAEQKLNVSPKVARFSFPLCTTINMNACAAFILITVMFVAQSQGMSFTLSEKLTWILIATVAAIGNAGVPMGCFFIASALLSTMNLPLTLMGIILPFYALLDMLESAINIWSDACVTVAVQQKTLVNEAL
ncbi:MAG: dicarboxylate/amino acid:cation symporter [Proteobacteria bacterium]|nr:dicarboxylate/amino acid:cation symporter [Pseudomonadota bacterium]